jgi:carbon monoxide dehydrogenase subunit G
MQAGVTMQTQVVTQINIDAKPAAVFEYLTNLKLHHLWNPQVQSISSQGRLALGSEYETRSIVLGVRLKSKNVVTACVKPKELEITNDTGIVKYRARFALKTAGKRTVVSCTTEVSADGEAFAFAKPIMKLLARRELQADMQALKIAVEHQLR